MKISEYKINYSKKNLENSYSKACRLDIECIKPGNVNYLFGHHDTFSDDFINSYQITAKVISQDNISLGNRIKECVLSTKSISKRNTNLGIILLCSLFAQSLTVKNNMNVSDAIKHVVLHASKEDVLLICESISMANPGGLGNHEEYDVTTLPDVSLQEIMRAASDFDNISNQYSNYFRDIFNFIIPTLSDSIPKINDIKMAISYTFLKTLEKYPDSHISRKYDHKIAKKTSNEASDLIKILDGDTRHESWGKNLMSLDKHFKMARVNPGTTADLLVVSMMIYDYFIGLPNQ